MATPDAIDRQTGLSDSWLIEVKPEGSPRAVQAAAHPAIIAWLNGQCPGLVRPGSRIAVVEGSEADAAEIVGRGYEAICGMDPPARRAEAVIAPASRADAALKACRGRGVIALVEGADAGETPLAAAAVEACGELTEGPWRVRSYRVG